MHRTYFKYNRNLENYDMNSSWILISPCFLRRRYMPKMGLVDCLIRENRMNNPLSESISSFVKQG